MIAIRTDANIEISIGHVMRCLSIADALRRNGEETVFILSSFDSQIIIDKRGYKTICLNNDYRRKEDEIDDLLEIIKRLKVDCLIIDSYEITENYMKILSEEVATAYIDDLVKCQYKSDIIINYSIDADIKDYKECICNKYLLGSSYTPIRREFSKIEKNDNFNEEKHVLISTGGSDHYDMSYKITEAIIKSGLLEQSIILDIVIGRFYNDIDRFKKLDTGNGKIRCHFNTEDMWRLMGEAFVSISASGTTVAELCTVGVPVINYITADNQKKGAFSLKDHKIVVFAGDVRDGVDTVIMNAIDSLKKFLSGELDRDYYINKGKKKYDGLGAERIALEIIKTSKKRT